MGPSTSVRRAIRRRRLASVGGGDGMYNVFELETNRYLFNESQFGPLRRAGSTGERKASPIEDPEMRWNWNSPILVSPHDSNVIYHAATKCSVLPTSVRLGSHQP